MLDISSAHVPELLIVSSSSTNEPRQTFPKLPELAIAVASSGAPAVPDTSIIRGPVGSYRKPEVGLMVSHGRRIELTLFFRKPKFYRRSLEGVCWR